MIVEIKAIAIDGPSGAGKSTVAKMVAEKLGFQYIDTGAMYRAITLKVLEHKVDPKDETAVTALAKDTTIELLSNTNASLVLLDGKDVSSDIRGTAVTANVSAVCSYGSVRAAMVKQQRNMAKKGGVVMDGRDIGTHVLPDALLKVFLTASSEERGLRRYKEWQEKGIGKMTLDEVIADINRRDTLDSTREINPLIQAEDGILLNSDGMTSSEVTEKIIELWRKRTA